MVGGWWLVIGDYVLCDWCWVLGVGCWELVFLINLSCLMLFGFGYFVGLMRYVLFVDC